MRSNHSHIFATLSVQIMFCLVWHLVALHCTVKQGSFFLSFFVSKRYSNRQLICKHSFGWLNRSNDYHWNTSKVPGCFRYRWNTACSTRDVNSASTWGTVTCQFLFFSEQWPTYTMWKQKSQTHNLYFTKYPWTKIDFYFPMLYVQ